MRIYKVLTFAYTRANSLLPPRAPEPAEVAPVEAAVVSPLGQELINVMVLLGWSEVHAASYYRALYTYFWYTRGLHSDVLCNQAIRNWIDQYFRPAVAKVRGVQPEGLPPQVIYYAVVIGIVMVAILLVAPEWEERYHWAPPCNLYLGVYNDQLWWLTLSAVTLEQRPLYKAISYSGGVIVAHTYEHITPPTVTDRFHFYGTVIFECWQIPWFRRYRLLWADCEHIGLAGHTAGDFYGLREGGHDPWAPAGPVVIPEDDYCLAHSPCS